MSDHENPMLEKALGEVPVPAISHDFNHRVLARLQTTGWSWRSLSVAAKPVFVSALASLVATLAILDWSGASAVNSKWTAFDPSWSRRNRAALPVWSRFDATGAFAYESHSPEGLLSLGSNRAVRQEIP